MKPERIGCWMATLLLGGLAVISCRRPDYFPLKENCFYILVYAPAPYGFTLWLAPDAGVVRWTRRLSVVRAEILERIRR